MNGRSLEDIPCARSTLLTSITSGFAAGIINFMFTSNIRRSCDRAMQVWFVVNIGYW